MKKFKLLLLLGVASYGAVTLGTKYVSADSVVTSPVEAQTYNLSSVLSSKIIGNDTVLFLGDNIQVILHNYKGEINEISVSVSEQPSSGISLFANHGFANSMSASTTISTYSANGPSATTVTRTARNYHNYVLYEATYKGSIPKTKSVQYSSTGWTHHYSGSIPYISSKSVV